MDSYIFLFGTVIGFRKYLTTVLLPNWRIAVQYRNKIQYRYTAMSNTRITKAQSPFPHPGSPAFHQL